MKNDFNREMNRLELRVDRLEQNTMVPTTGVADVGYDEDTGLTTIDDHLDWSRAENGWEPYSTVSAFVFDDTTGEIIDGGELSTAYGRPEAHLVGRMCVLTGMVRRKAGALTLGAGVRHNLPMFGLPDYWRPLSSIILPCLMGNSAPGTAAAVGTAWVEITPGLDPLQQSGTVSYIAGTVGCSPSTGWIALQGIFPCDIVDTDALDEALDDA